MTPIRVELAGGKLDGLVMYVTGPVLRIPRERKVEIATGPTASYEWIRLPCLIYRGFQTVPGTDKVLLLYAGFEE